MPKYPNMFMIKRIVDAKLFIDAHYAEQINLDAIADSAHYSKYHFIRHFTKAFGKSPYEYLKHVRLKHAKKLLLSDHSIQEVCFAVGYDSPPSFSNLFKKHTGISPSAFIAQNRKVEAEIQSNPFTHIPNCFAEQYDWKKRNSQ